MEFLGKASSFNLLRKDSFNSGVNPFALAVLLKVESDSEALLINCEVLSLRAWSSLSLVSEQTHVVET